MNKVFVLNKTYGPWSAGTRFTVEEVNDQTGLARCQTFYQYPDPKGGAKHWEEEIPIEFLTAVRDRS
jgi:hypothetical protein